MFCQEKACCSFPRQNVGIPASRATSVILPRNAMNSTIIMNATTEAVKPQPESAVNHTENNTNHQKDQNEIIAANFPIEVNWKLKKSLQVKIQGFNRI